MTIEGAHPMYKHVLVTLDCSPTDRTIIEHVKALAAAMHSHIVLLHVASSVPARFYGSDAAGAQIESQRNYLENTKAEFSAMGISAEAELAYGEPVKEIIKWVEDHECDLVAMATHGHQFVADLVLGTTAIRVQHGVTIPVLLLRAG